MHNLFKNIILTLFVTTSISFAASSDEMKQRKAVFDKWCVSCHGVGMPATAALSVVYKGSGITPLIEKKEDLAAQFVTYVVRKGR